MPREVLFWILIAVVGAGTFGLRLSFIALLDKIQEPPWFRVSLRYIPAAVLSALLSSGLLIRDGELSIGFDNQRLLAGLVAGIVGYTTRSLLWTILTGLVALFVLSSL